MCIRDRPGTILDVKVAAGAAVKAGDVLCILAVSYTHLVCPKAGARRRASANRPDKKDRNRERQKVRNL